MKRCLGSPGCNLNDVHTQCGRLSLGGVHDFCAHFTARRLWLGPHWGPGDSCRFWPGWNENERLIWKPWFHFFQGVWFQINESGSVSFPENVPKNPYLKGLPKIKWSKYRKKHSKLWSVLQHFLLCGLFRSVPCFCFGSCLGSWLPPHLYAPTTARRYLRAAPSSFCWRSLDFLWGLLAKRLGQGSSWDGRWVKSWAICFLLPLLEVSKKGAGVGHVCSPLELVPGQTLPNCSSYLHFFFSYGLPVIHSPQRRIFLFIYLFI